MKTVLFSAVGLIAILVLAKSASSGEGKKK